MPLQYSPPLRPILFSTLDTFVMMGFGGRGALPAPSDQRFSFDPSQLRRLLLPICQIAPGSLPALPFLCAINPARLVPILTIPSARVYFL
jgi:hypothetical protein